MIHVLLKKPVWQMNGEELLELQRLAAPQRAEFAEVLGQPRNFLNGENHVVFLIDFHFQQFLLNALRHIAVRGASGKLFLEQLRFRVSQILEIDRSYLFHQGIQYILL